MIFTDRVRALIKEKGITQDQFNKDIGISKNTLAFWEKEERLPKEKTLDVIADYFDVSVEYLTGLEERNAYEERVSAFIKFLEEQGYHCNKSEHGYIISKQGMIFTYPIELFRSLCNSFSKPDGNEYLRQWLQKLVPNYEVFDTRPVGKQTRLPVYGNVSAGKGCYTDTDVVAWEVADEKYDSDEYFYLLVTGDSMSPDIKDGDYALVHSQDYIESGQIGVCVVDDEGFIKKIEYGEDTLTLVSINPYYPPRKFEKYDMNNVHIIGRVIETKRKY